MMSMDKKKGAHILSWLAVLALFIFYSDLKAEGRRFSIKFMGGISSHSLGDVNAYLEGASQYKIDDLKFALLNSSFSTLTGTLNHRIKAIPLSVGIQYALPLSSKTQWYLFSGGEFYFSKFSELGQERLELKSGGPGYAQTWEAVTKATGLGFYGGLGFELGISREVSLLIEAQARRARISGFSGTSKEKFNQSEDEESFDLYYYEFYGSYLENSYKFLNLPNAERGFNLRALRDAIIDLSGFSLKAGIKIHL